MTIDKNYKKTLKRQYFLIMLLPFVIAFLLSHTYLSLGRGFFTIYHIYMLATEVVWYIIVALLFSTIVFHKILLKIFDNCTPEKMRLILIRFIRMSTILTILLGFFFSCLIFIINKDLRELPLKQLVNTIIIIFYEYIILPPFLINIVLKTYCIKIEKSMFKNCKVVIPTSKNRIWLEILISFIIIIFIPIITIFLMLNAHGALEKLLKEDARSLITIVISVLSFFITGFITAKFFTEPINQLINSFKKVSEGDFDTKTPVLANNNLGKLIEDFNKMVKGLKEREVIRDTFGKYISPEIAKEIIKKGDDFIAEEKTVTILFTDIEGYTSISEKLTPKETVRLLNTYFSELVEIIKQHNGIVNKFIGDAILAFFNAPTDDKNHAINAVKAGIQIVKWSNNYKFQNNIMLKTRVGINTGKVIIGNIGSKERKEYTTIGDAVNTAQRLEAYNKKTNTNILLSHETFTQIDTSDINFKKIGAAKVKGKLEDVIIYTPKIDEQ